MGKIRKNIREALRKLQKAVTFFRDGFVECVYAPINRARPSHSTTCRVFFSLHSPRDLPERDLSSSFSRFFLKRANFEQTKNLNSAC